MGSLRRIQGIMDKFQYEDILENNMRPYARNSLGRGFIFQQDNDTKHRSKHIQNWMPRGHVTLLACQANPQTLTLSSVVLQEEMQEMPMKSSPNLRKNGGRSLSPSSKLFSTLCLVGAKLLMMPMGFPPSINMQLFIFSSILAFLYTFNKHQLVVKFCLF
ncbi:Transposable element Tcb2 transposase [Araneus ventricosus]|uniref:Transposable element Tcb2 transposase n=1 Tax=Araneus ventricosus TaxID=182803 RepID=A0A4Y2JQD1_ARAVE|nr:Transposable element Tcb2 transposase [Araneus ventricosus]